MNWRYNIFGHVFLLISLIASSTLYAQVHDEENPAEKVWQLIESNDRNAIYELTEQHQEYFRDSENSFDKAVFHFGRALYYLSRNQTTDAHRELIAARPFVEDIDKAPLKALILHNYALYLFHTYQLDLVEEQAFLAIEAYRSYLPDDAVQIGQMYGNLGNFYTASGNFDAGYDSYQKSRDILEAAFGYEHPTMMMFYGNMSMVYHGMGDTERSVRYKRHSLDLAVRLVPETHPFHSLTFLNYANGLILLGKLEEALEQISIAEDIRLRVFGEKHPEMLRVYFHKANAHRGLGQYDEALVNIQKAVSLAEQHQINPRIVYQTYELFGTIQLRAGKHAEANATFDKLFELIGSRTRTEYMSSSHYAAENLLLMGEYEQAKNKALEVFELIYPDFDSQHPYRDITLEHFIYIRHALPMFKFLGDYYSAPESPEYNLDRALEMYRFSIESSWLMRSRNIDETAAMYWAETVNSIFFRSLEVAYQLHKKTGDEKYADLAVGLLQNAKATSLFRATSFAGRVQSGAVPEEIQLREAELRNELSKTELLLHRNIEMQISGDEMASSRDKYIAANAAVGSFVEELRREYPDYELNRYKPPQFSLQELRQSMPADATYIEYLLNDDNSKAFVLAFDKEQLVFKKLNFGTDITPKVDEFRTLLSGTSTARRTVLNSFAEVSHSLYKLLLAPVVEEIYLNKQLVIFPDAALHIIPFDALITKSSEIVSLSQAPFLIRNHTIKYHYSTSLFQINAQQERPKALRTAAVFAPVFSEMEISFEEHTRAATSLFSDRKLGSLPFSELEAQQVSHILRTNRIQTNTFLNKSAKLPGKRQLNKPDILHFATHGFFNSNFPSLSALAFYDESAQDSEFLFAGEVYGMSLNADLVVLSGCDTGLGQIRRAEGVLSLNRAFLASGANNIVYTLWQISDRHTVSLMEEFYKGVTSGKSYADALRDAKLKMLEGDASSIPAYWAVFMLIGT